MDISEKTDKYNTVFNVIFKTLRVSAKKPIVYYSNFLKCFYGSKDGDLRVEINCSTSSGVLSILVFCLREMNLENITVAEGPA